MATPPPDPKKGDIFSARWLNALLAFLRSLKVKSSATILAEQTPSGQILRLKLPQEVDVVITGGPSPYEGKEQQPVTGGTWVDLPGGRVFTLGTDALYERNNHTGVVAGTYVHATRDVESGALIFDRGAC